MHLYPVTDGLTALGVADIYFHNVFPLHGIPKKIVSNWGPQFASRIMRSILKCLGVDAGLTTAYHLQANGQTEHKNQEIEQYLRMFINTHQDDWTEFIPTAEFMLNSHVSSASGHTPFELLYGYTPDFMVPMGRPLYMPAADRRLTSLHQARKDTEAALHLSKECMKTDLTTQQRKHYAFKVGDKVWLQAKEIKIHIPSQKLGLKQLGPFEVMEVISEVDYRLKLPPVLKLHDVFHIDCLSPYQGNEVNGLLPPPPQPVGVEGEEEYEVDHVRDVRMFGKTLKFLVRWKGYGEGNDSWEPAKNLKNTPYTIDDFYKCHPGAPEKINAVHFTSMP